MKIDGAEFIDTEQPKWRQLKAQIEAGKKLCTQKRGAAEHTSKDLEKIEENMIDMYYPEKGEQWNPHNLNKVLLLRLSIIDSCRGGGWDKREIDDLLFGKDANGNKITIKEAKWTKTMKTADAVNNDRNEVTLYERLDGLGIYSIARAIKGLRPHMCHTTAKALKKNLFLVPKPKVTFTEGFEVGYYNKAIGRDKIKDLWHEICDDNNVDRSSVNSIRTSMASLAVKRGMNLALVADVTSHKSTALDAYIRAEQVADKDAKMFGDYQNLAIESTKSKTNASSTLPTLPKFDIDLQEINAIINSKPNATTNNTTSNSNVRSTKFPNINAPNMNM